MSIIYPINRKKYKGRIENRKLKDGTQIFYVRVKCISMVINKTFLKKKEATSFLKNVNKKYNLKIKNIVIDKGNYFECTLTRGKFMKFDKQDIHLVDKYLLYAKKLGKRYYAYGNKIKGISFHNLLLPNKNKSLSVDHINRNGLDNRRSNLRLVSQTIQSINQDLRINNTSGTVGVHFNKSKNAWIADWRENDKRKSKHFSVYKYGSDAKILATKFRKDIELSVPNYKVALSVS
jgi:hypothetical protein